MTSMTQSQSHVGCLVANVALGRDGKAFQREVERLADHMGPEWVVNRMKVLWNAANHLRNGDRDSAQELYQDNSIAYHKGDMTPKGPFRPAVKQYVLAQRPSVIKRKAAVLRFYTSFKLPSLTKKQWAKAYDAITSPSSDYVEKRAKEMARQHVSETASHPLRGRVRLASQGNKWVPHVGNRYADQLRATSYYYTSKAMPKELKGKPYASMTLSFLDNSYVPPSLDEITPILETRNILRDQDPDWDLKPVGKISALQEQGAKARVVCMPSAPLQLAFAPLHKELSQLAERAFPGASCVRDQQKGVYGVLRHMQEGKPVFCTDLSSATDRFPRAYSIELLNQLGYSRYAEALDDVCQKSFEGPNGEDISYGTGQPMGLYGSFPLFHLSNLMVAEAAERVGYKKKPTTLETFQNGRAFYVLGDDVVFSDIAVSQAYRGMMGQLGVPISEHKSFEGELAEFAGFMVTKSREGFVAFRPYKVPDGQSVSNPISFLDSLGSKVSKKSPYWARQWDLFKETTGSRGLDLSPHISEDEDFGPNPYRGDSRTLVDLANSLVSLLPDLPDISNAMRVNRIPLFRERRVDDYYGFSPEKMTSSERIRKDLPRGVRTSQAISNDPLMREVKMGRENPQSSNPSRLLHQPSQAGSLSLPVFRDPPRDKGKIREQQNEDGLSSVMEGSHPQDVTHGGDSDRLRDVDTSTPVRDHGVSPNDPTPVNSEIVSDLNKEDCPPRHQVPNLVDLPSHPSQDGVWVVQTPNMLGDRINPVKGATVRGRRKPTSLRKVKPNDFELD